MFKPLIVTKKRGEPVRQKRPTTPLKSGMANVAVYMTTEMREELRKLAKKSGKSITSYCRAILEEAARRELTIRESRVIEPASNPANLEAEQKAEALAKKVAKDVTRQ